MLEWAPIVVSSLALAGSLLALRLSSSGLPRVQSRMLTEARELSAQAEELALRIQNEWRTHRAGIDGFMEQLVDLDERVEKKRRSAAASASRAKQAQADIPTDPRLELIRRARAGGAPV